MFINYGGCVIFFIERTYSINLDDNYVYSRTGKTITLDKYVYSEHNVITPTMY